ncbi:TRAP transporter small permease [Nisaea sediminum]|uniref:TRAP transporter small permease n=1 Tax=Nisaea sediminum TaxID=2775867 RepID=UPI0018679149|nr:TRAP transporter small permease [Nisaea sediminum]
MAVRRLLDGLYLGSGYLSALFLVAIAVTIVAQIVGRFFGVAVDSTESAGFCLAASTFLGLAYTFRHDGHIRVTLLVRLASGPLGKLTELWAVGFCAAGMAYMAYWAGDQVYFSFTFGEKSKGLLAIPLWIPQSAMALGTGILTIALVDEFISILLGRTPSYVENSTALFQGEND